ncbi:MAG TPA: ELWxxDGT repeat protein [Thermoanaerobaculia bacterium]|nr:ELWxxDGT repeat protein [Thermoanaerobaculia bacterium]
MPRLDSLCLLALPASGRRAVPFLAAALLGWALLLVPTPSGADPVPLATLSRDLVTVPAYPEGSFPTTFQTLGDRVLFLASDAGGTPRPWATDGTREGTVPLTESPSPYSYSTALLGTLGDRFLFTAPGRTSLATLWATDGTSAGTEPISPDALEVQPYSPRPVSMAGQWAFLGYGTSELAGVWITDGTRMGTRLVAPLAPLALELGPYELATFRGSLYFSAKQAGRWALFRVDLGTGRIDQLALVEGGAQRLTAAGDRLFFVGRVNHRFQLWSSDGTATGTRPITRFKHGWGFSTFAWLAPTERGVHFIALERDLGYELYFSNGRANGTRRLTHFAHREPFAGGTGPQHLFVQGDEVTFPATDGESGLELWRTGSRRGSLTRLSDVCAGACNGLDVEEPWVPIEGGFLFRGTNEQGSEIWRSDGTARGTGLLAEPCAGPCGEVYRFTPTAGGMVFVAPDSTGARQVWETDGTAPGTRRLTELPRSSRLPRPGFYDYRDPSWLGRTSTGLFFAAPTRDGDRFELWHATSAVTEVLAVLRPGVGSSNPFQLRTFEDRLLFDGCDPEGPAIFASDGSAAGTVPLERRASYCSGGGGGVRLRGVAPQYFRRFDDGTLFVSTLWKIGAAGGEATRLAVFPEFVVPNLPTTTVGGLDAFFVYGFTDPVHLELWRTDGTAAGTRPWVALAPAIRWIYSTLGVGSRLYLWVDEEGYGALWVTDGTPGGTQRLRAFPNAYPFIPPWLTEYGGEVYFAVASMENRVDAWVTDGTVAGTRAFLPLVPWSNSAGLQPLFQVLGDRLLVWASPELGALELLTTDGTVAGTSRLRRFVEPNPYLLGAETALDGAGGLYLVADDGLFGRELWHTDGTAEGTRLVADVRPGALGANPGELEVAGGRVFFAADDGRHGREPWASDGTTEGTTLVQDLAPGGLSSQPEGFTTTSQRAYFVADDGVFGRELWSVPLDAGRPICEPSATALCLGDGRFRVEAALRDPAGDVLPTQAASLSAHAGVLALSSLQSPDVAVKLLDGRAVNGSWWLFTNALTSFDVDLTLTDTLTRESRRYHKRSSRAAGTFDLEAFDHGGMVAAQTFAATAPSPPGRSFTPRELGPCVASPERLCLAGGRFAVEVRRDGTPVPATALSDQAGTFSFFAPENPEGVVKILDGRDINGHFWLFYGGLTLLGHELVVTDTQTGTARAFDLPEGKISSVMELRGF